MTAPKKDEPDPAVTPEQCNAKHGRTWWALGLLFSGLFGLVGLVVLASSKVDSEIQRSTTVDEAQQRSIDKIYTDQREAFDRVEKRQEAAERRGETIAEDIKTLLRNGTGGE